VGCDNCYAETFAERWRGTPGHYFENGFDVQLRPDKLGLPLRWRKPRRIFVNSMSDLFHESVPDGYIAQVWEMMAQCPQHTFQILTKRHARMRSWVTRWHDNTGDDEVTGRNGLSPMPRGPEAVREVYSSPRAMLFAEMLDSMGTPPEGAAYPLYDWMEGPRWFPGVLPNVWLGVSTENQQWADIRIPALLDTPAAVRFVSAEPLLGPIDLIGQLCETCDANMEAPQCNACYRRWRVRPGRDNRIDWVIVGGESGPGARPMHPDWVRSLRDQCQAGGVPFLFKQWGEYIPEVVPAPLSGLGIQSWRRVGKKAAGRELDGREWNQYPQQVCS